CGSEWKEANERAPQTSSAIHAVRSVSCPRIQPLPLDDPQEQLIEQFVLRGAQELSPLFGVGEVAGDQAPPRVRQRVRQADPGVSPAGVFSCLGDEFFGPVLIHHRYLQPLWAPPSEWIDR